MARTVGNKERVYSLVSIVPHPIKNTNVFKGALIDQHEVIRFRCRHLGHTMDGALGCAISKATDYYHDRLQLDQRPATQAGKPLEAQERKESPMSVEARFYITGVESVMAQQPGVKEDGTPDWNKQTAVLGGKVNMSAAKHGTFGRATPYGTISMTIANPEAYSVFRKAFEESVAGKGRLPVFKVYFELDPDQEFETH